jgi:hypothetical protein
VVCHLVALRGGVSRCPRTYSGRDSCLITVGAHRRLFHGRPRTGRAGGVSRLDAGRRVGRASPCVRPRSRVVSRPRGGPGKAGALVARAVVRDRRAERARVARAFTAGVLGPGHPCGDDAALLVSDSGTASGIAARALRGRRSRSQSGPPAAWSGSRSPTAAARGVPQLRPCGSEAEGGRGWGWWRDWPCGGGGGAAGGR